MTIGPDDLPVIRAVATEHTWAHERLRALADALEQALARIAELEAELARR